jgi:hypothetical protein
MLGYHPVKTKMLVGQWRLDLVGLAERLLRITSEYTIGAFGTIVCKTAVDSTPAWQAGALPRSSAGPLGRNERALSELTIVTGTLGTEPKSALLAQLT